MTGDEDLLAATLAAAVRDAQTVTAGGERTAPGIHGVSQRRSPTHVDDRGMVVEMLDPRWKWHPDPIVTSYVFTLRPGHAKGWALHKEHEDRYFLVFGELQLVLYDVRPDSPTCGQISSLVLSEYDRSIINIPAFVWHGTRNLGSRDVVAVNFPTAPYDHANPDKFRLPIDTPLIPYSFEGTPGW
jgi:dTDP-4-dehydrorhamnose 3,5-epimerase